MGFSVRSWTQWGLGLEEVEVEAEMWGSRVTVRGMWNAVLLVVIPQIGLKCKYGINDNDGGGGGGGGQAYSYTIPATRDPRC